MTVGIIAGAPSCGSAKTGYVRAQLQQHAVPPCEGPGSQVRPTRPRTPSRAVTVPFTDASRTAGPPPTVHKNLFAGDAAGSRPGRGSGPGSSPGPLVQPLSRRFPISLVQQVPD